MNNNGLLFGVPLETVSIDGHPPKSIVDIIGHIARDGATTTDIFRRPGSPNDIQELRESICIGREFNPANYSFFTLASIVKKFLYKLPSGLFGPEIESELLSAVQIRSRFHQQEKIYNIIHEMPLYKQRLLSLLIGTWFRISTRSEHNAMSSVALSRSLTPALFHTSQSHTSKRAEMVLRILIDNFTRIFSRDNIRYFAIVASTRNNGRLKSDSSHSQNNRHVDTLPAITCDYLSSSGLNSFHNIDEQNLRVEINHHSDSCVNQEREECCLIQFQSLTTSMIECPTSPSKYELVQARQLERLKQRSDWFLSKSNSNCIDQTPFRSSIKSAL